MQIVFVVWFNQIHRLCTDDSSKTGLLMYTYSTIMLIRHRKIPIVSNNSLIKKPKRLANIFTFY